MGEIVFSICAGGLMVLCGIIVIVILKREERSFSSKNKNMHSENIEIP